MKSRKPAIIISLLIIAVGSAWLLNSMGIIPGAEWMWVGGLGILGVLLLTLGGLNRFNVIASLALIVCSLLFVLQKTDLLKVDSRLLTAPILFVTIGLLLLLATATIVILPPVVAVEPLPPSEPPKV